jgi:hypothetical protein
MARTITFTGVTVTVTTDHSAEAHSTDEVAQGLARIAEGARFTVGGQRWNGGEECTVASVDFSAATVTDTTDEPAPAAAGAQE